VEGLAAPEVLEAKARPAVPAVTAVPAILQEQRAQITAVQ
jgi:hypothetical protein